MGSILPACLALLAAIWAALHALPKPAASLTRKPVCNPMVRCSQGRNRGRPRAGFFEAAASRLVGTLFHSLRASLVGGACPGALASLLKGV